MRVPTYYFLFEVILVKIGVRVIIYYGTLSQITFTDSKSTGRLICFTQKLDKYKYYFIKRGGYLNAKVRTTRAYSVEIKRLYRKTYKRL